MQEKEKQRQEAFQEYIKEKGQVDMVIQKMIQEDQRMMELIRLKQEQAKSDMIMSIQEKREMQKRQKELEEYENEMLRRFQEQ